MSAAQQISPDTQVETTTRRPTNHDAHNFLLLVGRRPQFSVSLLFLGVNLLIMIDAVFLGYHFTS